MGEQWLSSGGRIENLKPWKPGQSGNPGGRPKYRDTAETQLAAMLSEPLPDGVTMSEHIVNRLLEDARKGKPHALKLALDRILPVVQEHEHRFPEPVGFPELEAALDRLPAGTGTAEPAHGANGAGANGSGNGAA